MQLYSWRPRVATSPREGCSFSADAYQVLRALTSQDDVTVLAIKDYVANPYG